ncbi:MAG: AAA family ATPase [Acidimicrobiales bacterium]|jgi:MoxR-like ATPase
MTIPLAASPPGPRALGAAIVDNVSRVVLGKDEPVRMVVAALLAGGHVLVEDVPGVGKTLLAKSLARSIGGTAARVQGTADLMPSDVTGVTVYDQGSGDWRFRPGPVFSNVVLVDEINRATPRAQSALLEAMGEGHTTVDGVAHPLPVPFFVIATQNPFGDVGTFPLLEGQSDRFAVVVSLGLPDRDAERAVIAGGGGEAELVHLEPVVDAGGFRQAQAEVAQVHVEPGVVDYVLDLAVATRTDARLARGASPRAASMLLRVAKAHAVLVERDFVTPDDVKAVAAAVLAHRLGTVSGQGTAVARGIVADIMATVASPPI